MFCPAANLLMLRFVLFVLFLSRVDLLFIFTSYCSAPAADRIAGGVIKCVGCYFFAVLSAYLPFFFWSDHPAEVKTCTMSRIYGQHVHRVGCNQHTVSKKIKLESVWLLMNL